MYLPLAVSKIYDKVVVNLLLDQRPFEKVWIELILQYFNILEYRNKYVP